MSIDGFEKEYIDNFYKVMIGSNAHRKHTVLIVDDEDDNLQLLRRTLRKDYNILTASSGKDALGVMQEKSDEISLIISDYKMPVMTGTEFLEQVAKTNPNTINMLLTGHSDLEIVTDAVNKCNLFQYIVKPFEPDSLKLIIQNGIETYELYSNNHCLCEASRAFLYNLKSISAALVARDSTPMGIRSE
jgi:response regulator RpfG family c-di-GMP phosphodiesterase